MKNNYTLYRTKYWPNRRKERHEQIIIIENRRRERASRLVCKRTEAEREGIKQNKAKNIEIDKIPEPNCSILFIGIDMV